MAAVSAVSIIALCAVLCVASAVDVRTRTVPNACIAVAACARLAELAVAVLAGAAALSDAAYYVGSALAMAASLVAFTLAFDRITGTDGMGGGDIKLYAIAALYLGWERAALVVAASCAMGAVWGIAASAADRLRSSRAGAVASADAAGGAAVLSRTVAFAPFISLAMLIALALPPIG